MDDFEIDISSLNLVGRKAQPIEVSVAAELTGADIARLQEERPRKSAPSILKRVTQRHHMMCKHIANGMSIVDVAIVCNLTPERVHQLLKDPSVKDLVTFYSKEKLEDLDDVFQRMAGLSLEAAAILQDRMDDEPDKLGSALLLQILEKTADRTGHGPMSSTNVNVNVNMADRLNAARKRVAEQKRIAAIEPLDEAEVNDLVEDAEFIEIKKEA